MGTAEPLTGLRSIMPSSLFRWLPPRPAHFLPRPTRLLALSAVQITKTPGGPLPDPPTPLSRRIQQTACHTMGKSTGLFPTTCWSHSRCSLRRQRLLLPAHRQHRCPQLHSVRRNRRRTISHSLDGQPSGSRTSTRSGHRLLRTNDVASRRKRLSRFEGRRRRRRRRASASDLVRYGPARVLAHCIIPDFLGYDAGFNLVLG